GVEGGGGAEGRGPPGLLRYDRFRRASFLAALSPAAGALDPLEPWDAARLVVGERPLEHELKATPREVAVLCSLARPDGLPMAIQKSLVMVADEPALSVGYRLLWEGEEPLDGRWAVQRQRT